jgi:hypothetical protein
MNCRETFEVLKGDRGSEEHKNMVDHAEAACAGEDHQCRVEPRIGVDS